MQEHSKSVNGLECKFVGRPTKWGNPFKIDTSNGKCGALGLQRGVADSPKHAVIFYEQHIRRVMDASRCDVKEYLPYYMMLNELSGKNLACFCAEGQPCHADILLKIANG